MAGRCVNCGACEMACPECIDVRALAAKMCRSAEELFDYRAGIDPEQKTLLSDYDVNDTESGFME
jgi:Fe-S oxidoreductase